jgi:hypothetical protein
MAYGDLKVRNLIWNTGSGDNTVVLNTLATTSSPTFTGTVTVPTATAGDNSTKAASTAFVVASFAPKANPTFTGTVNGADLVLSGNLTVNGTTTTINTQTLDVEDKNVVIGKVSSPSDTTADGGGLTLLGASNKTWNWVNATDAWTSSEHIHLGDNKKFLAGTDSDLEMYHTGSGAYIQNKTGNLFIGSNFDDDDGGDIRIQAKYGENSIVALDDGSVELYYDNSKKLETTSNGIAVTGAIKNGGANGSDLTIYNDVAGGLVFQADENGHIFKTYSGSWQTRLTITDGGDCLIGATSGTHRLTVQGSGTEIARFLGANGADLRFRNSTSNDFLIYTGTSDRLLFGTNGQNVALTLDVNQNATFAGTVSDSIGDVRKLGYTSTSSAYTLLQSDNGKFIEMGGGGVTAPSGMAAGTMITIVNVASSDQTITQGSNFTLTNAADASTGNRTLASKGMATILFLGSAQGSITGAGLS